MIGIFVDFFFILDLRFDTKALRFSTKALSLDIMWPSSSKPFLIRLWTATISGLRCNKWKTLSNKNKQRPSVEHDPPTVIYVT